MDPFKRTIYLLALNELGQITSAELRTELAATVEQMKAELESQPAAPVYTPPPTGY